MRRHAVWIVLASILLISTLIAFIVPKTQASTAASIALMRTKL